MTVKRTIEHEGRRLVAHRDENHGVEGYRPCVYRHYLFAVGTRFYVTIDGSSRTWLSPEKVRTWLNEPGTVMG